MDELDFKNVRNKSLVNEIMDLIEFAKEHDINVSKSVENLGKVLAIAEKRKDPKLVDELMRKIKLGLEESINVFIYKEYNELENIIYSENITDRQIEITKKLSLSAIGIKHYRLALENIKHCKSDIENLKKPKFEKLETTEVSKCEICLGNIKPGMSYFKCSCGKAYHEACATRAKRCSCGVESK